MNVRHPNDVLHSISIKNIFYDKMDVRLLYFYETIYLLKHLPPLLACRSSLRSQKKLKVKLNKKQLAQKHVNYM